MSNWKEYCNTAQYLVVVAIIWEHFIERVTVEILMFQRYKYFRFARPHYYFRLSVAVAIIWGHLHWTRGNRKSYRCGSKLPHYLWLALRALATVVFGIAQSLCSMSYNQHACGAQAVACALTAHAQGDRCSLLQSSNRPWHCGWWRRAVPLHIKPSWPSQGCNSLRTPHIHIHMYKSRNGNKHATTCWKYPYFEMQSETQQNHDAPQVEN